MSVYVFFFGWIAGILTALSLVALPRPRPRPRPRPVQMVAPSLPPMAIAPEYRKRQRIPTIGDRL